MPYIKANHNWIKGVKLTTIDPQQRSISFIGPFLDSRGYVCRQARKEYQAYKEKKDKFDTLNTKKELTDQESAELEGLRTEVSWEIERDLILNWMLASCQQQYHLEWDHKKGEQKPDNEEEIARTWREVFMSYFTEDDLERFQFCMDMGREYTKAEMLDWVSNNKELIRRPD